MGLWLVGVASPSRADEKKVALKDVPKAVLQAAKKLFPDAEIRVPRRRRRTGRPSSRSR